ncbi:MAG: hypothetical protein ACYCW6_24485 [Candidatus Xenobia bacterium]
MRNKAILSLLLGGGGLLLATLAGCQGTGGGSPLQGFVSNNSESGGAAGGGGGFNGGAFSLTPVTGVPPWFTVIQGGAVNSFALFSPLGTGALQPDIIQVGTSVNLLPANVNGFTSNVSGPVGQIGVNLSGAGSTLYVLNSTGNDIAQFEINQTGITTPAEVYNNQNGGTPVNTVGNQNITNGPVQVNGTFAAAVSGPLAATVTSDQTTMYLVGSAGISGFIINPLNGALSAFPCGADFVGIATATINDGFTGASPQASIVVDAAGQHVFATDSTGIDCFHVQQQTVLVNGVNTTVNAMAGTPRKNSATFNIAQPVDNTRQHVTTAAPVVSMVLVGKDLICLETTKIEVFDTTNVDDDIANAAIGFFGGLQQINPGPGSNVSQSQGFEVLGSNFNTNVLVNNAVANFGFSNGVQMSSAGTQVVNINGTGGQLVPTVCVVDTGNGGQLLEYAVETPGLVNSDKVDLVLQANTFNGTTPVFQQQNGAANNALGIANAGPLAVLNPSVNGQTSQFVYVVNSTVPGVAAFKLVDSSTTGGPGPIPVLFNANTNVVNTGVTTPQGGTNSVINVTP